MNWRGFLLGCSCLFTLINFPSILTNKVLHTFQMTDEIQSTTERSKKLTSMTFVTWKEKSHMGFSSIWAESGCHFHARNSNSENKPRESIGVTINETGRLDSHASVFSPPFFSLGIATGSLLPSRWPMASIV